MSDLFRCFGGYDLMDDYHDNEWGRPEHDDSKLFEMLTLEGAQAGLSWSTILNKREGYRKAFSNFDIEIVSKYDEVKIEELLNDKGIVRNKLKVNSVVINAKAILEIIKEYGSFDSFIWGYVNNTPIIGNWKSYQEIPITTDISDKISKDLKKRGFKFVGSTIIYSFMQAVGMVDDHLVGCITKG